MSTKSDAVAELLTQPFRPGDRVRYVWDMSRVLTVGTVVTVNRYQGAEPEWLIGVRWDDTAVILLQGVWCDRLVLVDGAPR